MINIHTISLGQLETNCYIVADKETSDCLIIDPADEGDLITQKILDEKLHPTAIILTHGHFDHVLACLEIKLNFGIPVYLHPLDNFLLKQAQKSAKHFLGLNVDPVPPADFPLADDQVIHLGAEKFKVIHTPGHTPGSICLLSLPFPSSSYSTLTLPYFRGGKQFSPPKVGGDQEGVFLAMTNGVIFTGDTLFSDAVGRTDLSYSSPSDLTKSLKKLKSLFVILNSFQDRSRNKTCPELDSGFGMTQNPTIYPGHGPSCPISSSALYPSNQEPLGL